MNRTAHMAAGFAACFAMENIIGGGPVSSESLLLGGTASLIGAILPDCDNDKSGLKEKIFHLAQIPVYCILYQYLTGQIVNWAGVLLMLFAIAFGMKTGHRTATHSIPVLVAFTCLMYAVTLQNSMVTVWFMTAYASHLFLDMFNKKGLMLFWPVKKLFCLGLTRSNKLANRIVLCLSVLVIAAVTVNSYIYKITL